MTTKQKVTGATVPARPVTRVRGTGTTANPTNCPGSGKPWATGGKCPECGARDLPNGRRGADLTPRVPIHPPATDARSAADAAVLNGIRTADKVPASESAAPPARPATRKPTRSGLSASSPAQKAAYTKAARVADAKAGKDIPDSSKAVLARTRKVKDPLTAPFTSTIDAYLLWLKTTLTSGGLNWDKIPRERLAGLAITMYGRWQVSDERRAQRNGH